MRRSKLIKVDKTTLKTTLIPNIPPVFRFRSRTAGGRESLDRKQSLNAEVCEATIDVGDVCRRCWAKKNALLGAAEDH